MAEGAVAIYSRYAPRIAHVQSVGTLYSGADEVAGSGSGLLIGRGHVLTNSHVIPEASNYRALTVSVRLLSREKEPRRVVDIARDRTRDLALLRLEAPVGAASEPGCPMPIVGDPDLAPIGETVFVLGFPLNQQLSIMSGLISNHDGGGGRWQTDTLLVPGHSGGPAFGASGELVGLAVGGIVSWRVGDELRPIAGINLLIPAPEILASPLFATLAAEPLAERCWAPFQPTKMAFVRPPRGEAPQRITRSYFVSETKDDHPVALTPHSRRYERAFTAEPGYQVMACAWIGLSENHQADVSCTPVDGGAAARLTFRLTSGPAVDRWRGWLTGNVALTQERTGAR